MGLLGRLILPAYSYDLALDRLEFESCDARAYQETWTDMLKLQEAGVYPQAFDAIDAPVIMLHGAADPHPGRMIRAKLQPHLSQLQYHEWERCGHYPWLEKAARREFFALLHDWLARRTAGDSASP
jgi:pimeloyl-ACP methyl ester carboxylesterase